MWVQSFDEGVGAALAANSELFRALVERGFAAIGHEQRCWLGIVHLTKQRLIAKALLSVGRLPGFGVEAGPELRARRPKDVICQRGKTAYDDDDDQHLDERYATSCGACEANGGIENKY